MEVITFARRAFPIDRNGGSYQEKRYSMKTGIANKKLEAIIAGVEKDGVLYKGIVEDLKELREQALKEQDPLVVKVLRLCYEFLQERKSFDVQAQYEEDEEGNEYPLEIEDQENLLYLLNLLKNADHKINREEIKDYRTSLKQELY
jgi:TPP-dependent pyruvate/acetoin dehydrogenase alpha subunit